jgi:hypothetical protein
LIDGMFMNLGTTTPLPLPGNKGLDFPSP